jgi:hypothetical protein
MRLSFRLVLTLLLPLVFAACSDDDGGGGTGSDYTVGGTVSGLKGSGLVLEYGGEQLTISENGDFTFEKKAAAGAAYEVKVVTQPTTPAQTCTVTNGSGAIAAANVTSVLVTCGDRSYKLGGSVTGLSGTGLKLKNGTDTVDVTANGPFTFPTALPTGAPYAVTVSTQPSGQRCTVSAGEGTIGTADVTSVTVNCDASKYTLGGSVTGLAGSLELTSGTTPDQTVTVTTNGAFAFPTALASGTAYDVKVKTVPTGYSCAITRGTGTVATSNVTNIVVACSVQAHLVNVTVSKLVGTLVVKNGTDSLTFTADGTKAFNNKVVEGATYLVTVGTQPATQTCTSSQTTAKVMGTTDVTETVTCVTNQRSLGGSVSGLAAGESVTLANGAKTVTVSANGSFAFADKVDQGSTYTVTVTTSPAGKQCSVTNGSGTVGATDVTNVAVTCSSNAYTVGGSVSGLAAGGTLKLLNNGADELTVSANGAFTFATPVAEGGGYNVTISAQPANQVCTVTNGSGSGLAANVTTVAVSCANTYTVGGTVTGLSSGKTLVLTNNGGDDLTVTGGSTTFTFATRLNPGAAYAVAVKTQPAGLSCAVANGSGTVASANVTTVSVTCSVPAARVVVLRAGDGTTALSSAAAAVTLDTYGVGSTGGALISSVAVTGLTIAGSSGSEGFLSRSADGRYVVFAGYDAAAGTAAVAGTTASATAREVGRFDGTTFTVAAKLTNAFSTSNVRSATSVDGSAYWVAGTSTGAATGGVHYVAAGSTGASTRILADPNNSRVVSVFNGQLYLSSGSGAYITVSAVGSGTPTTTGQTATGLTGVAGTSVKSPYQFFFLNASTLYLADDTDATGGVLKFTKDSSNNWTQSATLPATGPVTSVVAVTEGSGARIVATQKGSSGNKVITFLDDGTTSSAITPVATAPANYGFRGVALAPNP